MSDALDREQLRRLKGSLMRALGRMYGRACPTLLREDLADITRRSPVAEQLDQAIAYLVDQGYVKRTSDKLDALDTDPVIVFECTAKGSNLVNGEATDPGVEF